MRRKLTRSTVGKRRTAVVTAAVMVVALGACGGDDSSVNPTRPARTGGGGSRPPAAVSWPTGSDDVVLRLGGGPIPKLLIAGDGRAYSPAARAPRRGATAGLLSIAPAPAAPTPMIVRQLTPAGMSLLFARAAELGLLEPPPDYADVQVTDALSTSLLVRDDDGTYVHKAYALGYSDEEVDDERQAFADMVDDLADLPGLLGAANVGDAEPYVPVTFAVTVEPASTSDGQRWPPAVPLDTGCVDLPVDRFPDGVSGSYLYDAGEGEPAERVWVVPDLPGDDC